MMNRRLLVCLFCSLLLSGCILVKDFTPKWNEGKTDICLSKIAESLYYGEFRRDPTGKDIDKLARSFTLGKYHFLMLKQDTADTGGRMYRFGVLNGIFQRYRLDPTKRKSFEAEHPDAPVSLAHDTVEVENLGPKVIALLEEISNKPDYWEIEDQTLYNVLRNPDCIYEDRDLQALANQEQQKAKR